MKKLMTICAIIFLSACNSGGSNSAAGTLIVAGNWSGLLVGATLTRAETSRNRDVRFKMIILQGGVSTTAIDVGDDEDAITVSENVDTVFSGIYSVSVKSCGIVGGNFTGTVSGAQVTFDLTDNSGAIITLNGNITNATAGIATAMNGLFNAIDTECGTPRTGTWSITRQFSGP